MAAQWQRWQPATVHDFVLSVCTWSLFLLRFSLYISLYHPSLSPTLPFPSSLFPLSVFPLNPSLPSFASLGQKKASVSWVLIWCCNWMTRDSSPSLPHESAEFSWLLPPTPADYRHWAGTANCQRPIQVFVSLSHHPAVIFQGWPRPHTAPHYSQRGFEEGTC